MSCSSPLQAWRGRARTPNGKYPVVFHRNAAWVDRPIELPCGRCITCKAAHAQAWAIRCYHEASFHLHNYFVTLTYNEPPTTSSGLMTLRPEDFTAFMHRLRKAKGPGLRFFHAAEYGKLGRPHHHVLLFNANFPDKTKHSATLYRSAELEKLWPHGYSSIGNVTPASAAYVARYTVKKFAVRTQLHQEQHPEYQTMSRRPGIGRAWYEHNKRDAFPRDAIPQAGTIYEQRVPRYYRDLLQKQHPRMAEQLKARRAAYAITHPRDTQRLRAAATIASSRAGIANDRRKV